MCEAVLAVARAGAASRCSSMRVWELTSPASCVTPSGELRKVPRSTARVRLWAPREAGMAAAVCQRATSSGELRKVPRSTLRAALKLLGVPSKWERAAAARVRATLSGELRRVPRPTLRVLVPSTAWWGEGPAGRATASGELRQVPRSTGQWRTQRLASWEWVAVMGPPAQRCPV